MATVEEVIEQARRLEPHELERLRGVVDDMLAERTRPKMTEDEFERYLAAKGIITLPEESEEDDDDDWEPIEVEGKPLSEMIIEDRR